EEAAARVAEEHGQYPLLDLGEQRVGQARGGGLRSLLVYGALRTHGGYDKTRSGYGQARLGHSAGRKRRRASPAALTGAGDGAHGRPDGIGYVSSAVLAFWKALMRLPLMPSGSAMMTAVATAATNAASRPYSIRSSPLSPRTNSMSSAFMVAASSCWPQSR